MTSIVYKTIARVSQHELSPNGLLLETPTSALTDVSPCENQQESDTTLHELFQELDSLDNELTVLEQTFIADLTQVLNEIDKISCRRHDNSETNTLVSTTATIVSPAATRYKALNSPAATQYKALNSAPDTSRIGLTFIFVPQVLRTWLRSSHCHYVGAERKKSNKRHKHWNIKHLWLILHISLLYIMPTTRSGYSTDEEDKQVQHPKLGIPNQPSSGKRGSKSKKKQTSLLSKGFKSSLLPSTIAEMPTKPPPLGEIPTKPSPSMESEMKNEGTTHDPSPSHDDTIIIDPPTSTNI